MVHDRRIELLLLPWKGSVLTDRRIVHSGSFYQELPNLLAWEVCRRVATSSAMLCLMRMNSHTTYRGLLKNYYYTSTNLARQQLFCNLEVRVGIEPTNNSFADCDITILSSHYNSGTACRNRTHIRTLEECCPIHWTNAVLVRVARIELARPKSRDFKSLVSTYFTILAFGGRTEIRTQGTFLFGSFQDCWFKPLTHSS